MSCCAEAEPQRQTGRERQQLEVFSSEREEEEAAGRSMREQPRI